MLIGYARVSTNDQDLTLQIEALTKAGCERLFTDKASGAKAIRPGLTEALHFGQRPEIHISGGQTCRQFDGFDTSTPSGRLLFHILASVAEMERELVKERTIAGLAAARARGGTGGGRKPAMTPDKIDTARKLLAAGDSPAKIAKLLQVGLSTFYRYCPGGEPPAG